MPDHAGLKPARLFIALWPEEAVRHGFAEAGASLHKRLAGRLTRPETIHLTLVFIGELALERIPDLLGELGTDKSPAFSVNFDQAGCWRHNRIAYLAPSQPPQALFDLVIRLEQSLDKLAITYDRRPYKPHVTLIRKAECENPALGRVSGMSDSDIIRPVSWSASRFVLVESVSIPEGVRYDVLGRFNLL
jgi:2'-5' RNA ligase